MNLTLHWTGDWPEHLGPLLEALQALPETEAAPPGAVVLCPDALALTPPDAPAVALVPDVAPLLDPSRRARAEAVLCDWARRGASIATPTEFGARLLRGLPGVVPARVWTLPLPLPSARVPAPWPDGRGVVALHAETYRPLLAAAGPLALAGLRPPIVLAAGGGEPLARPGGIAGGFGLLGGRDVLAVSEPAAIVAHAGVIVLGQEGSGLGWMLRQALATGRPVVAPSTWLIRDHLAALKTSAYLHNGQPEGLVNALAAALRDERGAALGAAARTAVVGESWSEAARGVYRALCAALAPPARRVGPAARAPAVARGALRIEVVNLRPSGGGGERFMRALAGAMAAHASRPRVRVVCRLDPAVAFDPGADELRAAGVELVPVTGDDPAALAAELGEADVVYCSWPHLADPPPAAAPLVCTYHDLNFTHFDVHGPAERGRLEAQTPRWIERCEAIVHSSRFIEQELHRHFTVPAGLTHVIPLAAEPPAESADPWALAAVRASHGLGEGRFLLSPNGNHLHKNYAALSAALRLLRECGRPVRVIATGFATETFHGPDLIGLGYVSAAELSALYATCSGIVQTTLYEAGSFPMIEAMAAGRPAAISAIAPVLEQTERLGLQAETFDPLDPQDIAAALWRLWNGSPATEPAARDANRRAVLARSWDDVAGEYLALLGAIAAGSPAPALT